MNHTIFVVTYRKDFEYLKYCLKSYEKFCDGYEDLVLVVPGYDFDAAVELARQNVNKPVAVRSGEEWPNRGMLWAMTQKCRADEWCPRADIIHHIDADCVFTEPVTPLEYMRDGKPLLLYESFVSLNKKGIYECDKWKVATEACLPFGIERECMRCHPEVYQRDVYAMTRRLVEQKTGKPFDEYVGSGPNSYPQQFCEHNALGNVALHCFPERYSAYNLEHEPWRKQKLRQAWSHRAPTPDDLKLWQELGLT